MQAFVIPNLGVPKPNPSTLIIASETSIGIEDVRQIQAFLSNKPMGDKNRVYLLQAETLTIPAQNALLKTLEEPPGDSEIYLVTDQPEQLLPTVLSRVQINTTYKSYKSDTTYAANLLARLRSGNRLQILDEEKFTREQLLKLMADFEELIHQDLALAPLHKVIVQMRKYLKANCNLKLCLAFFAANL